MGAFLQYLGMVGGRPPELYKILKGVCSGIHLVCIRDLGYDPQDQADPWWISPQGVPLFGRDVSKSRHDGAVLVPLF